MQRVDHAIERLCANAGSSLTYTKRQTQNGCEWTLTLADCSAPVPAAQDVKAPKPPKPESPDPMAATDEPDDAKVCYTSKACLCLSALCLLTAAVFLQDDSGCDVAKTAMGTEPPQKRQRPLKECAENWKRKNQRKIDLQRACSREAQAINVDYAPAAKAPAVKMSQEQREFLQEAVQVADVGWSWDESELYDDEKLRDLFSAVGCGDPDLEWEYNRL